jgi:hypothetical protein
MSLQQIDIRTLKTLYGNMKNVNRHITVFYNKIMESATETLDTPEDPPPDWFVEEDPSDWLHELHAYAEMISKLDPSELRLILDTPEDPPPDWLVEEDPSDWYNELSVYAGLET